VKDLQKDNIKRHNKEIKCEIPIQIHPGQDKDKWHAYQRSTVPSGSTNQNIS
jgi:hypothetical protein